MKVIKSFDNFINKTNENLELGEEQLSTNELGVEIRLEKSGLNHFNILRIDDGDTVNAETIGEIYLDIPNDKRAQIEKILNSLTKY